MFSISTLAKKFGLSRSTLLYYDSIGLLRASSRSHSNYRRYGTEEVERLARVCQYRKMGLPLKEIQRLLDSSEASALGVLERRLLSLNAEINRLREQQRVIVKVMKKRALSKITRALDKAGWVALLRSAGLDDEAMNRWHVEFEKMAPESHQDFLESLGLDSSEVERIRKWSTPPE